MFSVTEVAELYGVSRVTVNSWIESGQLAAINVSGAKSRYHRYRIAADALAKFEESRASGDHQPTQYLPPVQKWI